MTGARPPDAVLADAPIVAQNIGSAWRESRPRSADGTREALTRVVAPGQSHVGASAFPTELAPVLPQSPTVFAATIRRGSRARIDADSRDVNDPGAAG